MANRFYIVDVFTEQRYSGNPLAIVVGSDSLPTESMQRIAAEMNFSETTFVTPEPEDSGYRVRIFTPSQEIAFAGHPILGTAWVIRQYLQKIPAMSVILKLTVGDISVRVEQTEEKNEVVWFRAPAIMLGACCDRSKMAAALGVAMEDIDAEYPVQQLSANTSAVVVPLRSLDALKRSKLNLERYTELASQGFPPLVYLFSRETHQPQNNLCARFFFEAHGVREDPATGNGAAFLGAYLLEHHFYTRPDFTLRIEQGYELRRPSLIMLHARQDEGTREISVGGHVVPVVQGELL
ncbi:MAG: PhzF family phenazine biosynthesis isomerase [Gammaproteobacteria bacterium]|nr:PhzF family phenazine biosynthesis isomerase [Gammaproteobacteria bacterium]